ncbi:hypothetical protein AUJ68_07010 [Candidatus Woesearchaeota archaeon CG1_02_57_44]|nr:MAG: hypothetical protein AUJ68_07010 [Candidatus Woesearchaeota archaeon CG1_02_57_44]
MADFSLEKTTQGPGAPLEHLCSSSHGLHAVSDGMLFHYQGKRWHPVPVRSPFPLGQLSAGTDALYSLVGRNTVFEINPDGDYRLHTLNTPKATSMAAVDGMLFYASADGALLTYSGDNPREGHTEFSAGHTVSVGDGLALVDGAAYDLTDGLRHITLLEEPVQRAVLLPRYIVGIQDDQETVIAFDRRGAMQAMMQIDEGAFGIISFGAGVKVICGDNAIREYHVR